MSRVTNHENTKNLALIDAALAGNNTAIQNLISAKADVNTKDSEGNTPLMLSGSNGNIQGVEKLIKAGADISLTNDSGKKFIDIVCDKEYNSSFLGRLRGLNLLKIKTDPTKKGANKLCKNRENVVVNPELFLTDNDSKGLKLIQATLEKNHLEMHNLIDNRAPVDYLQVSDNRTALMLALSEEDIGGVGILMTAGANVSLTDDKNKTAIDIVCDKSSNNTLSGDFSNYLIESDFVKIKKDPNHDNELDEILNQGKIIQEACQNNTISFVQQKMHPNIYSHIVGNTTLLLPATTVATIAATTLSSMIGSLNNLTEGMASFNPDNAENMGWLTMAAVGVAAVGLVGGLVWGTRTCLNLNKTVKNYDLNPPSTELSLIEHS